MKTVIEITALVCAISCVSSAIIFVCYLEAHKWIAGFDLDLGDSGLRRAFVPVVALFLSIGGGLVGSIATIAIKFL